MDDRGQFSIIAALLVAIVLIGTLLGVYAMIRYDSTQNQSPQALTATDETNSAILKALGFTVGYYGSMLQVTGNQTYAEENATAYMNGALQYIESMNPSWGESISMRTLNLETDWFSNPSISTGQISVLYDLTNLGIHGINYTTSCSLGVQIFNSPKSNQVCLNVTQDMTEPLTSLGQRNFAFYVYNYSTSNWQLENPTLTPIIFTNGTYLINTPSGTDSSAFMVQVTDSRGIMVEASSFDSYNMGFTFGQQSITQNSPVVVELMQNGTLQTLGQDLTDTTPSCPIPPIPVKALHLCPEGSTSDIPFQVEDWASQYRIPLGLTSNYTIFSSSQMIVFEVTPSLSKLTLWWNGSDTAIQPSTAYTDLYFKGDNPGASTLTNGKITLQFSYPNSQFEVTSTVGGAVSTVKFMRIDGDMSIYGSGSPAYVIQNGVIRDIVQEEAEWSHGPTANCPNVYSQIVLTLPANSTFFTYQLRLIFINSAITRSINDVSPLQLSTTVSSTQALTENGVLSNGTSNVSYGSGIFNNATGSAHHWSELINSGGQGTGIMFTDSGNQQLYVFDHMANAFTGALNVNQATPKIELDPVTTAGTVSFATPWDITWYGAVATFNGANPVYTSNGNSGLWPLVDQPPSVAVTLESSSIASISVSPSAGVAGTTVAVQGGGFLPDSPITITYDGKVLATPTSTEYGAIPSGTIFEAPESPIGTYTIAAYSGANSAKANYNVTASPMESVTFQLSGISNDTASATILTIDSKAYSYSSLPVSFVWQEGSTHTISAANLVSIGTSKQYQWESWSDSGAQTHNYTVPASSATVTANYACQYQVTFNYQVLGGVNGYSAPAVTYYSAGSLLSVTAGPSAKVWVDTGTTYTYTSNPLTGSSSSERWYTLTPQNSVSCPTTISPTYYNQYAITFQYNVPNGGTGYTAPQVTYIQNGISGNTVTAVTSGGSAVWVDAGTTYTNTDPLSGSGSTEQWAAASSSGTASGSGNLMINYYNQYKFTLSYTITDGGSGYSAPTLTGTECNQAYTPTLTGTATAYWLDSGSSWSVTNPLTGSSSSERWDTSQTSSGTVSGTQTTAFTYYNQYGFTLSYSVSGSGTGYTAPTLTTKQFGSSYTPTLGTAGTQYWLDAGQPWSVTNPLSGSGSSERWETSQTVTGTVGASSPTTAGNSLTFTYYNQYKFTLSYTVSGGGSGYSAPTLTATEYGQAYTPTLTGTATAYWLDASQPWSVTNPLTGSSSSERWDTSQTSSGTVSASQTIAYTFYNQYSITFGYGDQDNSAITSGSQIGSYYQFGASKTITTGSSYGVTSPASDWVDAGSVLNYQTFTSGSQRWALSSSPAGFTVSSSTTISEASYYHQYQITPYYTLSDSSSPTVTNVVGYTQFGSAKSATPTKGSSGGTAVWVDSGSAVTYTSPISGTGQRWQVASADSGTYTAIASVSSSTTATVEYYHQYQITPYYTLSDSSAPTVTNVVGFTQFGSAATATPTKGSSGGTAVWVDAGSAVKYTSPINGASGERWQVASADSGTHTAIASVSSSTTATVEYYHQYQITPYYTLSDSSSPTVTNVVGYTSFGSATTATPTKGTTGGTAVWADAGSAVTYTSPISGTGQRWQVASADSGTHTAISSVSSSTTATVEYYHQYQITPYYTLSDSSSPTVTNVVGYTQFGSAATATPTKGSSGGTAVWVDAGSAVTYTSPISGTGQRWQVASADSGTHTAIASVSSSTTATVEYYHQYSLTVTATSDDIGATFKVTYTQFGTTYTNQQQTTTWSSWADAGTTATVSSPQSPYNGHNFSNYSPSSSVTMNTAQTITLNYNG